MASMEGSPACSPRDLDQFVTTAPEGRWREAEGG